MRLTVALFVAVLAGAARAHHVDPRTAAPALDPLDPRLVGVTVQLQHTLADQLVVENRTGRVLEVVDEAGVPFLRLGPDGAEGNAAADAWYVTASAGDVARSTRPLSVEPRWVRVADDPAWGWFDGRLRAAPGTTRWSVPLRLDGEPLTLSGTFRPLGRSIGTTTSRVTSPPEPLSGVRVSLIGAGVPAVYVENASAQPVVVRGDAGEPFLRIGPDGTSANLRSPTWLASGRAELTGAAARPDASAAPEWSQVSAAPRYGWIEPRAATAADGPPSGTVEPTIVRHWTVPLERNGEHATIDGIVEWLPVATP